MKKLIMIFSMLALCGCGKEFLDRGSLSTIGQDNFWKTQQDATLGINGIYDALQDRVLYSGSLNGTAGLPTYDNLGDNCYNSYKFEGPGNFMIANVDPSNILFSSLWTACYKGIGRANLAIQNIPKVPSSSLPDAQKQQLLGQALLLRSLFYMHLAVYYQDAPLVLNVQALPDAYVPKNTFQEIYTQIIADLKTAANVLPNSYPAAQYGYATKGAAYGLLARMYLYNKDYQGALDATTTLLSMTYSLNSDYGQLFTEAGENSPEIIFSVRFNQGATDNDELFSSTFNAIPKVDVQPMPNLVKEYYAKDGKPITSSPLYNAATPKANRDPRLAASVYFKNDIFLTDVNKVFTGNTATTYGLKKYIRSASSASGIATGSPGGQDFIVLRYADVLLMRAEAMVELNQLPGVYSLINQVRARVSMPTVESVEGIGLSQTQLRAIVRHERRIELAFEGLRYFDLKRWGTLSQAYAAALADNVAGYAPLYQPNKSEIFPIPQSELDANSNLVQNPVWR